VLRRVEWNGGAAEWSYEDDVVVVSYRSSSRVAVAMDNGLADSEPQQFEALQTTCGSWFWIIDAN